MLRVLVLVVERHLLEACFERFRSHCVRRRVSEVSEVSEASCPVDARYAICVLN